MDQSAARTDRRSQLAMVSFFALTVLLALAAGLTFENARTNTTLSVVVLGLMY